MRYQNLAKRETTRDKKRQIFTVYTWTGCMELDDNKA